MNHDSAHNTQHAALAPRRPHQRRAALALAALVALALGVAPPAHADVATPPDPLAAQPPWAVTVTQGGLQHLPAAALAAAGLDLGSLNPALLQLWLRGTPIPLEEVGTGDGRLDPGDELRFYARPPGDRWNTTDTYWLGVMPGPGARIGHIAALPPGPAACPGVEAYGRLGRPSTYVSHLPGPDGDHWFLAALAAGGDGPAWEGGAPAPTLPVASGTARLVIGGSATGAGPHHLQITLGPLRWERRWQGAGDWRLTLSAPWAAGAPPPIVQIATGAAAADTLLLDEVAWSLPVDLRPGGRPAQFTIRPGPGGCRIDEPPTGAALYAIGAGQIPLRVDLAPDALIGPGDYQLVGAGDPHTPAVRPRSRADLTRLPRADIIYIAPAGLVEALAPLVDHRRRQSLAVQTLDIQQIYDAWSGGAVDPGAIRAFLRWARAAWQPPPRAVALVGDGTADPHNYSGRGSPNLIPPYLAMVDPYLGETACEVCFAQLDGADPRGDPQPDLLIGRLPVKSADELRAVVAKIISYETATGGASWRSRALLLADNAREADGRPDRAGDFAAVADHLAASFPPGIQAERLYYDPLAPPGQPWREPDAVAAHRRTLAALRAGAGLVVYVGHAHYWQWASTDPTGPSPALLELLDIDTLDNGGRLPVVLSMTCLSSAFQQPSYSGTTIDELLLLHPTGGAVAVWGSSGLGVLTGHAALLRGFTTALWRGGGAAPIGELVQAGHAQLLAEQPCCADSIWTFVLLGDPLTPARVVPARRVWLPLLRTHPSPVARRLSSVVRAWEWGLRRASLAATPTTSHGF